MKNKLAQQTDKCINENSDFNINTLIEGENYAVLKILQEKFTESIDVICIDPPYNTGMKSLNYDDSEYNNEWINFIKLRLELAYKLLSETGMIYINIDETEINQLLSLCYKIFGKSNVDLLIWPKTDAKFDKNRIEKPFRDIKITHEYVLVCFKNRKKTTLNKIKDYKNDRFINMETIFKGLGTTSSAKDELAILLGSRKIFQTPKPLNLIKEFIRASTTKKSIVMDFFAGSGTTGHATMELNKEDSGERNFILINNNENKICENITYKRLLNAVKNENYLETINYYKLIENKEKR